MLSLTTDLPAGTADMLPAAKGACQQSATQFLPLDRETRAGVDTDCAAFHLNRSPQTLRKWAMGTQRAPIQPRRVNGRLMWSTADLRKLCGV